MIGKNLSRVILSLTIAVSLSTGAFLGGQTAFANTQNINKTESQSTNITNGKIENYIANGNTIPDDVGELSTDQKIILTQNLIDMINKRTKPLTLTINGDGYLSLPISAKILNGKLIVKRGTSTGTLLRAEASTTGTYATGTTKLEVEGFIFDNGPLKDGAVFKNEFGSSVSLIKNLLLNDGYLFEKSTNEVTTSGNILNGGSLSKEATLILGLTTPLKIENRILNISGSVSIGQAGMGATKDVNSSQNAVQETYKVQSGKLVLTTQDGTQVSGDLTLTNDKFSAKIENLKQNTEYSAFLTLTDDKGNTYRRSLGTVKEVKEFTVTSSNVTSTSVNIKVNNEKLIESDYPLTYEFYKGTTKIDTEIVNYAQKDLIKSFNIMNLDPNSEYTVRFTNEHGLLAEAKFKTLAQQTVTPPSSGGGTVSGGITGGGSSSGGSSSSSSSITSSDIGKSTINDIDATLTIGSSTLSNSVKDGKDFKTNYEGVTATYENGKMVLKGLIPEKEYKNLTITYTDKNSKTATVSIATFKTKTAVTKLRQFLSDVYKYSLDRQADEKGFAYWEQQLKNKRTTADVFVRNLLNEKEFTAKHTTTSNKIKGLYQVIVNRSADTVGLNFWTNKYETLLKSGYTDATALNKVSEEMVGEQEFKTRVESLGI